MTKMLNLDAIAIDSKRTVRYKGKDYGVCDFNVDQFVRFQQHFSAFRKYYESSEPEDMLKVIAEVQALASLGIPGFPQDEIPKLNPVQMLAIVSMIANLIPDMDEETEDAVEEKKDEPQPVEDQPTTPDEAVEMK